MPERAPVPYPMLLEPRYLEKPWGGRRLEGAFGRSLPAGVAVGESWELFDRPAGSSRIRNGAFKGRAIADLRGHRDLPVLLKVLDIRGRFSIQVHPDEAAARARGAEAKSEAWVVLEAEPGARIWRGLRPGVTRAALDEAIAKGAGLEALLHSFQPKAGDAIVIPAGTVHAAGGGLLLAEIQQSSETTYRLGDWDRAGEAGRKLQPAEALEALRVLPPGPDTVEPREIEDDGNLRRLLLVESPWFRAEHLTAAGTATFESWEGDDTDGDEDRWHAMLVLSGSGTVRAFDRRAEAATFVPGDTLLLPAAHECYEIEPLNGRPIEALVFREGDGEG